jgi:hypothetical protein
MGRRRRRRPPGTRRLGPRPPQRLPMTNTIASDALIPVSAQARPVLDKASKLSSSTSSTKRTPTAYLRGTAYGTTQPPQGRPSAQNRRPALPTGCPKMFARLNRCDITYVPVDGASLASRRFAWTITQREDVAVSGQTAMAATGLILLSAHRHGSPRHPHLPQSVSVGCSEQPGLSGIRWHRSGSSMSRDDIAPQLLGSALPNLALGGQGRRLRRRRRPACGRRLGAPSSAGRLVR